MEPLVQHRKTANSIKAAKQARQWHGPLGGTQHQACFCLGEAPVVSETESRY